MTAPSEAGLVVATVDAVHVEVVREAFLDAEIDVELRPVASGFVHQPYYRLQTYADMRPMVDVIVAAERADEARDVMARLVFAAQEGLDAEALAAAPPDDAASDAHDPSSTRSIHLALALAAVFFLATTLLVVLSAALGPETDQPLQRLIPRGHAHAAHP